MAGTLVCLRSRILFVSGKGGKVRVKKRGWEPDLLDMA